MLIKVLKASRYLRKYQILKKISFQSENQSSITLKKFLWKWMIDLSLRGVTDRSLSSGLEVFSFCPSYKKLLQFKKMIPMYEVKL